MMLDTAGGSLVIISRRDTAIGFMAINRFIFSFSTCTVYVYRYFIIIFLLKDIIIYIYIYTYNYKLKCIFLKIGCSQFQWIIIMSCNKLLFGCIAYFQTPKFTITSVRMWQFSGDASLDCRPDVSIDCRSSRAQVHSQHFSQALRAELKGTSQGCRWFLIPLYLLLVYCYELSILDIYGYLTFSELCIHTVHCIASHRKTCLYDYVYMCIDREICFLVLIGHCPLPDMHTQVLRNSEVQQSEVDVRPNEGVGKPWCLRDSWI